jgi:hypothetical protein
MSFRKKTQLQDMEKRVALLEAENLMLKGRDPSQPSSSSSSNETSAAELEANRVERLRALLKVQCNEDELKVCLDQMAMTVRDMPNHSAAHHIRELERLAKPHQIHRVLMYVGSESWPQEGLTTTS